MELDQVDKNKQNNDKDEYDGGGAVVMDLTGESKRDERKVAAQDLGNPEPELQRPKPKPKPKRPKPKGEERGAENMPLPETDIDKTDSSKGTPKPKPNRPKPKERGVENMPLPETDIDKTDSSEGTPKPKPKSKRPKPKGEERGAENMPLPETDNDKTDSSEGTPISQQGDETEAGTGDGKHDQVAAEIPELPQKGKCIHPVTSTRLDSSDSTPICQQGDETKTGTGDGEHIYDQVAVEIPELPQKGKDIRPVTSTQLCEGWDIVEDSPPEEPESEEMHRPKFCTSGHSGAELILIGKAKFDAHKENRQVGDEIQRANTGDKSHKLNEEKLRRRAYSSQKGTRGSKKMERKRYTSESKRGERKVTAQDLNKSEQTTHKIEESTPTKKSKISSGDENGGDENGGGDEGRVDGNDDESYTIYDNSGHIVVVGDQDGNHDDKSNENDSDKPSSLRRKMIFGRGSGKKKVEGDDSKVKSQNEIRMNAENKRRRRMITTYYGVDHIKMGDMLGEMGHYGEEGNTRPVLTDSNLEPKPLFVQLNEHEISLREVPSWKPRARWIKFEETWEEGADKWGKPHVASLTFNSLPQLRRGLENGLMLLDVMETSLPNIFNLLVDGLVNMDLIDPEHEEALLRMLNLYGTGNKTHRPRSSAIKRNRRSFFQGSMKGFNGGSDKNYKKRWTLPQSPDDVHVSMPVSTFDNINKNANNSQPHIGGGAHGGGTNREGILRKLPQDAEGAMVMVAKEDSLTGPVAALIRLADPPVFDDFLEAPIPLRFIFLLVGPEYSNVNYREVGRAMSTLFSDDIFRELAYTAANRQDLLSGINEFLNDTMVLPPGDWDKDLLLPITRQAKREQEKVRQRRRTISPLQMQEDAEAILKMQEAFALESLKHADPLERTGRLFGGLINDVKRRFPHYKSDITDAFNFQSILAFVFVYFACLSPAITFGGLLGKKTDNWMGVSEMILSTSLCGMLFAVLSGQPLVLLGGTGPVLMFEEYLYKASKEMDLDFMAFRTWIGFWILILAIIVVAFEGSILVRYFTRFTEEIFSTLISVMFIYEVYTGLTHIICAHPVLHDYCIEDSILLNASESTMESAAHYLAATTESYETPHTSPEDDHDYEKYNCNATDHKYDHMHDYGCSPMSDHHPNTALFAIILTFGTFFISFFLKVLRSSQFLGRTARRALANFGIAIAIFTIVTIAYSVSDILYTDNIKITDGFHPTDPCKRGWLINPMGHKKPFPIVFMLVAIFPAFLVFILLYMETLLIGMVVNKESNKLHKGTGYHLDLFLIGILSALAGVMGLPWMCAAPIRTVSHIGSLSVLTRKNAPGVKPKLDHIKDQRVTSFAVSFFIGLSTLLAPVLRQVPIAALLGVLLYLGITSLSGLQFIERLKILFMPQKHHPDVRYIRMVKMWKMHMFTVIQVVSVMALYLIKNSIIALSFPFCLILLVLLRRLLKYFFSESELEALDCEEEDKDEEHQVFDFDLG